MHQNSPGHPVYLPLQANPPPSQHSGVNSDQLAQRSPLTNPSGRVYSQDDMQRKVPSFPPGSAYSTLQPKKSDALLSSDAKTFQRSVTPDITRGLYSYSNNFPPTSVQAGQHVQHPVVALTDQPPYYHQLRTPVQQLQKPEDLFKNHCIVPQNYNTRPGMDNSFLPIENRQDLSIGRVNTIARDSESLKMSPIDPRSTGRFQSSTPTRNTSTVEESVISGSQVMSPVKSTMSNEELYAVIHKSKKKMNIKSPPLDRAGSPALSVTSLSPGSSESSITGRITPVKMPETGYLSDARMRHSWSPNLQENVLAAEVLRAQETGSPRQDGTRQNWTCADRHGPPPQTSRLDFKKLLLQHGVKLNVQSTYRQPAKVSAVERLKLSREPGPQLQNPNTSNINILDLSGSPKTYTHRRIMRTNNPAPSSPLRTNVLIKEHKVTPKILLSPKTQWRFSSPRSDVLSSPIPEAFDEEESPNGSNLKDHRQLETDFSDKILENKSSFKNTESRPTPGARRSLIPAIKENVVPEQTDSIHYLESASRISPMKDNIFLATQENNFTKLEQQALNSFGQPQSKFNQPKASRAEILQAQKAQFLGQESSGLPNFNSSPTSSQFRQPGGSDNTLPISSNKCPSPPTLETAL